jgi:hypothetical protein
MVGGAARERRGGDLDGGHVDPGAGEDVVDAQARQAAREGAARYVSRHRDLGVDERRREAPAHR